MTLEPRVTAVTALSRDSQRNEKQPATRSRVSLLAGVGLLLYSAFANAAVLLQENFDGSLGQFTSVGGVTVTATGARMAGGSGTDGAITSPAINTVGFTALSVSYTRVTTGLDSGESGILEYSTNGTTFTSLGSTQSASGPITVTLPAAVENQAALRLRWRVNASLSTEFYTVDTVLVQGTGGGGGCEPNCPPDPCPPNCPPDNPLQRGPAPTSTSLNATSGPFSVASVTVSSSAATGYGGGTIYYPNNTTEGPFAAISVAPGYLSAQSTIQQWGPRLASWGFVVITITTNSSTDQPSSRATQLVAALDQVVSFNNSTTHAIRGKVDPARLGVAGWSMGGGGTLLALDRNPDKLKAGMGFAPYNSSSNFSGVNQPMLIFACESDNTAPVSSHALPFYNSIPASQDKAFAEVNNGSHSCANNPANNSGILGRYGVSWMKRFLDNDTRFTEFLCGAPHSSILTGTTFSRYMSTCPY